MKFKLLAIVVGIISAANAVSEEETGGQFYGEGFVYLIAAPEGWKLDVERWSDQGIQALFYLQGKNFGPDTPIFYVKPITYKKGIEFDIRGFTSDDLLGITEDPNNYVFEHELSTKFGSEPLAYFIDYQESNNYEFIVYKKFGRVAFQFILATQDRKMREAYAGVMKDFIDAFVFIDPDN